MRVAVALLSLVLTATAFPQCNLSRVASVPFRATVLDVAIDDNDLWAATSYGIALYDRSVDPPALVSTLAVPGVTRVVRVANGVVYAGSGTNIVVISRSGRALQIVRTIDAGGTVNDLLISGNFLYAATSAGLTQWDLLQPTAPVKTPAMFVTSSANVQSLARSGSVLFAADGDATVETFNIAVPAIPNGTGAITTIAGATSVSVAADVVGDRLYVSDGQQTDIFTNLTGSVGSMTHVATVPFGGSAIAAIAPRTIFAAGSDRRIRALDLAAAATPVELFRAEPVPTGGSVNRISRMVTASNRLYVAGGDLGLLDFDTTSFAAPFPLRSYASGSAASIASNGTAVYVPRGGAGITELTQSPGGVLTQARSWDDKNDVVWAVDGGFLLTTSGNTASLWALSSTVPTRVSSVTLRGTVTSAVLAGTTAYFAVNEPTTISTWSADMSAASPTATQIVPSGTKPSYLARSGIAFATAELRGDGTTLVSYFASSDLTKPPAATLTVPGLATGGIAFSGTLAAVSTFTGVTLLDFARGTATRLPQPTAGIALRLAFGGNSTLAAVTDTTLFVWNISTGQLTKQIALPAAAQSLSIAPDSTIADVATSDGVTAVQLTGSSRMPSLLATLNGNAYYRKLVATRERLYLFDGRNVDIFTTSMQYTGGIRATLITDVAASDAYAFTLQNNLTVTEYGRDGNVVATRTISEGDDVQPQSIASAGGAAWASIVANCHGSGCEGKTIVFDPKSAFGQTATMTGAVRDVVVSGNRAYVLTEVPNEVRVVDISDPAHPSVIASTASEGSLRPTSIAFANGTVYVLGDKLYTYSATTLTKTEELLPSYAVDATSGVTYADQHIRADGACVAFTGRTFSPRFLSGPTVASPSAARYVGAAGGTFYFLTDHSVEIWSAAPLTLPTRHRAAR